MSDVRTQRIGEFIGDMLLIPNGGNGYPGYGTVRIYSGTGNPLPITCDANDVQVDRNLTVGGKIIGLLDCLGNSDPLPNDGLAWPGDSNSVARWNHKHAAPTWGEVTGKPTNVSAFTNDIGYVLGSALGTAAFLNVGTSAGNVVQVQSGGALPALNGAALTGIVSVPVGSAVAVSADTTLDDSYANKLVVCTAALTLTLPAASGLPANWAVYVKPLGGIVTIARAGTDTVDGAASIKQPVPGWANAVRAIGIIRASSSAFYSY